MEKNILVNELTPDQLDEVLSTERYLESRIEYCKRMEKEGFKIVHPDAWTLLLDLDSEEAKRTFETRLGRLNYELSLDLKDQAKATIVPSKTKGHYHALVRMPHKLARFERIALQAVLGSDPVREILSIFRIWRGDQYPTLLAMKKKA